MVKNTLAALIISAVFILSFHAEAWAEDVPVVNSIEIRGLLRTDEGAVAAKLSQRTGEPLRHETIPDDIKNIFDMGYYDDVRVEVEPFEGGVKLIYEVAEKPSIGRVDVQGNKELSDEKLFEELTVTSGSMADTVLINENALRLQKLYEGEGYPLANVVPVLRRTAKEEVFLTYQIDEGTKAKIKKIEIIGNKEVSSRTIKEAMKTSEWWLFSFVTSGGRYKKQEMAEDAERIKNVYLDRGFITSVVYEPETELSDDKKWITVRIRVFEGERYTLSSMEFSGNKALPEETLRGLIRSSAGSPVSKRALRNDVTAMTDKYSEMGYALVSIYPDVVPEDREKTVSVTFRIEEGDIYEVGRIEISGNVMTRDKVIRREMLIDEGETFNSKALKRSYERITNLNFFEGVTLQPKPRPEEKLIDVEIDVKERPTGFLSVGGGYSSVDKLIAMVDVTQGNLGGRGQYVKLRGEFGGRSTFYELSFRDPWFLDTSYMFNTSIYRTTREYITYDKKATGFEIGLGRRFLTFWRANMAYNFEKVHIYDIAEGASEIIKEQEGKTTTSSVSPSITRDTRDSHLSPHTGSRNSLYLTYAGLGGDNRFVKAIADSSWFLPIGPTTFSIRGRYGHAAGLGGRKLPLYERFYVGGINTIRGLGFGQGGPRDSNGNVIGGEKQLLLNLEYTFPLLTELRLNGVVFFDAGTAFNDKMEELRYTAGAGIRWISPIGPLRLEWGYNPDERPGEKSSRWEFTFGSFF